MTNVERVMSARFNLSARLPEQVFRKSADLQFRFSDSALLTAAEGWITLQAMGALADDEWILGLVAHDLLGRRPVASLPQLRIAATASREVFIDWLTRHEHSRVSPLYVDARSIAFTGASGRWGLWIDQDQELAVLGVPQVSYLSALDGPPGAFNWVAASDIAELLAPSFYPEPVPSQLLSCFRNAYEATG